MDLSLRFIDRDLESNYAAQRDASYRGYDAVALAVHAAFNAHGCWMSYWNNPGGCWRLMVAVMALHVAQAAALYRLPPSRYGAARTRVIASYRALYVLATALWQPQCCIHPSARPQRPGDAASRTRFEAFWHSGLAGLMFYTMALPLPLAAAAPLQLATTALYSATFTGGLCSRWLGCALLDRQLLADMWTAINRAASTVLLLAGHATAAVLHALPPASEVRCLSTVLFLQWGLGCVLPLALSAALELRQRDAFLASEAAQTRERGAAAVAAASCGEKSGSGGAAAALAKFRRHKVPRGVRRAQAEEATAAAAATATAPAVEPAAEPEDDGGKGYEGRSAAASPELLLLAPYATALLLAVLWRAALLLAAAAGSGGVGGLVGLGWRVAPATEVAGYLC